MDISDALTILVLVALVAAYLPANWCHAVAEGIGSLVSSLADGIRRGLIAFEALAFRVVVGKWRQELTSSGAPEPSPDPSVVMPVAPAHRSPTNATAMPRNDDNAPVADCAHCAMLASITGDDPRQVQSAIVALARLHLGAKTAEGKPKVGETDAIRFGLGIAPSSSAAMCYPRMRLSPSPRTDGWCGKPATEADIPLPRIEASVRRRGGDL